MWTKDDGTLLSVVVEPSWLGLVHEGWFDSADHCMA